MSTLLVNLWGGPGTGKSTTATGLFSLLKRQEVLCEYVSEYAKDLTWKGDLQRLRNSVLVSGEQIERQRMLQDKVDVIITDSPVMLACLYSNNPYFKKALEYEYKSLCDFKTIEVFLERTKKYMESGRNQTETEALAIDKKAYSFLKSFDYTFEGGTEETIENLSSIIQEQL